jgi:hypothetical protein
MARAADQSAGLGIVSGALFLGPVNLSNSVESWRKVVMYSLSWACMCHVYQVSLARCTSIQIMTTLKYK